MKIDAGHFFTAWKSSCQTRNDSLEREWDNAQSFTRIILDRHNSVTEDVAKELQLSNYSEYYSMDSVMYREGSDRASGTPPNETWLNKIRVAIENENQFNWNLYQEICHLMILDCELRVLVTYPGSSSTDSPEMKMLHSLILKSDESQRFSNEESILVIFGRKPSLESQITWDAYVYKESNWKAVTKS
jgi:hypothetical protein